MKYLPVLFFVASLSPVFSQIAHGDINPIPIPEPIPISRDSVKIVTAIRNAKSTSIPVMGVIHNSGMILRRNGILYVVVKDSLFEECTDSIASDSLKALYIAKYKFIGRGDIANGDDMIPEVKKLLPLIPMGDK